MRALIRRIATRDQVRSIANDVANSQNIRERDLLRFLRPTQLRRQPFIFCIP